MNGIELTNIAIRVGELSQKTSIAITIAIIGGFAAVISAIIAGIFAKRLNDANKQHEKQWAFIGKKTTLFNSAIEIIARMLWNKVLLGDKILVQEAASNLFLLTKDCLVIEAQLLLYGNEKLSSAIGNIKQSIMSTPNETIREKWNEIITGAIKQIYVLKEDLGASVTEKFTAFSEKLIPPDTNGDIASIVDQIGSQGTIILSKPKYSYT
jgi:hypothetical protein